MIQSEFDIGSTYSIKNRGTKRYFIAISPQKLVSYCNGSFGTYTNTRTNYVFEAHLSVSDLVFHWGVDLSSLDTHMTRHFKPDEEAKERARNEKLYGKVDSTPRIE